MDLDQSASSPSGPSFEKVGLGAAGPVTVTNTTHTNKTTINVNGTSSHGSPVGFVSILIWTFAVMLLVIGGILALVVVLKDNGSSGPKKPAESVTSDINEHSRPAEPPVIRTPPPTRERLLNASKASPYTNTCNMKFVRISGTEVLICTTETRWRDITCKMGQAYESDVLADHPVVNLSLAEIHEYLRALSDKEEITYRLPTDREWSLAAGLDQPAGMHAMSHMEKAAETVSTRRKTVMKGNYLDQSYIRELGPPERTSGMPASTMNENDDWAKTAPVGSYGANSSGIFDLGGNVWEWCYDDNAAAYIMRGGSWREWDDHKMDLSYRRKAPAPHEEKADDVGFRCVIEIPKK